MNLKRKSSIFSGIYTYQDIPPHLVKTLLEELASNWLIPLFFNRGGQIGSGIAYMDGWVEKNSFPRLTKGNWQKIIDKHLSQYVRISVGGYLPNELFTEADLGGLAIQRPDWNSPSDNEKASFIEFDIQPHRLMGEDYVSADMQMQFVNQTKNVWALTRAEYAYITKDFKIALAGVQESPYEMFWRSENMSKKLREYTRGYYWGNILSDHIVERIGGIRVLDKQNFAIVEKLQQGWYIQLTDDINNIDMMLLHRLRDVLRSVLPLPNYSLSTDQWQEQHSYFLL